MPNRHYCGPREDTTMGDCNLSHFMSPKNEEKFCKYSYSSWCSTCERNSPRRRSKSETNEPCRRRCKEMKSLTPKKYNRWQEYENMEFEYETKGQWQEKDMRFECCRIRSNLCELPTSYISNNCQMSLNLNLPRLSNESNNFVDCLKSVTSYEQTLKFVDFNSHLENLGMQEKAKIDTLNKISPNNKLDFLKNGKKVEPKSPLKNGSRPQTPKPPKHLPGILYNQNEQPKDNHCVDYKTIKLKKTEDSRTGSRDSARPLSRGEELKSNCRESCPLAGFKMHDLPQQKPVCYDTDTYFDKRKDTANLRERYGKEIEYLRQKLQFIRNKPRNKEKGQEMTAIDDLLQVVKGNGDEVRRDIIANILEAKPKCRKEKKTPPPVIKAGRSRVVLKTRSKANCTKLKKIKPKPTSHVNVNVNVKQGDER